jgi:MFS family permease
LNDDPIKPEVHPRGVKKSAIGFIILTNAPPATRRHLLCRVAQLASTKSTTNMANVERAMNKSEPTFAAIPIPTMSSKRMWAVAAVGTYWRPVLLVFLPFSAGYFLSYFFRTINAVLASALTKELGLSASDLGLMTGVYFLTFAIVQLPLGILLDRFGPRRVQCVFLLLTAIGAALFAATDRFEILIAARALIGLGAAGALIAGLKAIVLCFPRERVPLLNGCFIMLGTLGAVAATSPAEWLLTFVGWRSLLDWAAATTVAVAILIFAVVPDLTPSASGRSAWSGSLKQIYHDWRFWRLAPLSTMCISTAWAVQGLWAERWLVDVDGLNRPAVVNHLLVMALVLSAGALLLGICADRLRAVRVQPSGILGGAALLFMSSELVLIVDPHSLSYLPWALVAGMGAGTVLSYSILAEYFPKEIAGQANAALNVFHIGGAFVLQEFIGWVIDRWPAHGEHYPSIAYKTALALIIGLQLIAMAWFAQLDQKLRTTAPTPSRL